jgi:hypothetical protein
MGSFSATHWVILAVFGLFIYAVLKRPSSQIGKNMFCKTCGHSGESGTFTRGSLGIEIVLWLCLLVPGIIYSLWRSSSRSAKCKACGSVDVVPDGSPVAMAMRKSLE